jgi:S1-C subfamily serine protease
VDIKNILNTKRPNDVVTVKLLRGETEKTMEVALIKAENNSLSYNGFEFENLTPEQRANYKIKYGVKITKVTNEKYLAYRDELEGALLLSVNNVKINSVDEARQLLSNQSNQQRTKIEILNSVGEYIRLLI